MLAIVLHCAPKTVHPVPQRPFLSGYVQKQKREKGRSPHEPFLIGFSSMIKVETIFQKPFAGITCLDHMITPGCKGVWESQESGKGDWLRSLQPETGQSQHLWSSGQEHRMIKKHVLTLQTDIFKQHGRSGGNLESSSFSEFQARMWLLAHCPSSFSIWPWFLPVPHEDSHTSKPCLSASCKQLPFRHSSSLGIWVVAALLESGSGDRLTAAGWRWAWGCLDREY